MKKNVLILFIAALTLAIAMPAMAILHFEHAKGQRVDMDGFIVFPMFYSSTDYSDHQETNDGLKDDADLTFTHWVDSRFTATLTSGDLSGTVQLGIDADFGGAPTRLLYATWTINDDMTLTVGKAYAPYYFWGNQRLGQGQDMGLGGYGSSWDDFDPGVTLDIKGIYVNLKMPVSPDGGHANSPGNTYFANNSDAEFDKAIPRIYVGYNGNITDNVSIKTAAGYNTFKVNSEINDFHKNIESWVVDFYADVNINDMFTVRGGGQYGSNLEELGYCWFDGAGRYTSAIAGAIIDNGEIEDTKTAAALIELHAHLGKITAMTGYGWASSDNDTYDKKDQHQAYYVRAEIPVYEHESGANLTVNPEINVFDEMKDINGDEQETQLNVGIMTQVHF